MTNLAATIDPKITISDNKLTLTGTASGTNLSKVEMFDSGDKDLGSAQLNNGSWTFTQDLGSGFAFHTYTAEAIDTAAATAKSDNNPAIFSGITDEPYKYAEATLNNNTESLSFYSDKGKIQYHGDFTLGANGATNAIETGDSLKTQFVFMSDPGSIQTITNFHVAGPSHDTLVLPSTDFANLAEVLRNTTMSDGSAVIHDPHSTASITLAGVSKGELKPHPHDFSFHGNGQLLPAA